MTNDTYTPVAYEYREMIEEAIQSAKSGKVFFFNKENKLDDAEGSVIKLEDTRDGMFITLNPLFTIRIDRIITLFGKPGPAYGEYERYGNSCMECDF